MIRFHTPIGCWFHGRRQGPEWLEEGLLRRACAVGMDPLKRPVTTA
jgi:hypothetical protein